MIVIGVVYQMTAHQSKSLSSPRGRRHFRLVYIDSSRVLSLIRLSGRQVLEQLKSQLVLGGSVETEETAAEGQDELTWL